MTTTLHRRTFKPPYQHRKRDRIQCHTRDVAAASAANDTDAIDCPGVPDYLHLLIHSWPLVTLYWQSMFLRYIDKMLKDKQQTCTLGGLVPTT